MNHTVYHYLKLLLGKWEKYLEKKRRGSKEYSKYNRMVLDILDSNVFNHLPFSYQEKVYKRIEPFCFDAKSSWEDSLLFLNHYYEFFMNEEILANPNMLRYLDVLLLYPAFPLVSSSLFNEEELSLKYLWIETKLYDREPNFSLENFEEILFHPVVRENDLTNIIITGIINFPFSRSVLIDDISFLLHSGLDNQRILDMIWKLFSCDSEEIYQEWHDFLRRDYPLELKK